MLSIVTDLLKLPQYLQYFSGLEKKFSLKKTLESDECFLVDGIQNYALFYYSILTKCFFNYSYNIHHWYLNQGSQKTYKRYLELRSGKF